MSLIKRVSQIVATLVIALILAGGSWSSVFSAQLPSGAIPLISIVEVKCDDTVSIRSAYFPANTDFAVLMNHYGTLGIGGTKVDTVNSGSGGVQNWTFSIPAALKGAERIAIRLENTSAGYFSYNWFWNNTPATCGGGSSGVTPPPAGTIPTFNILAVEKDATVTIRTSNLPANDKFDVLMNTYGTLGVGGVKVTQVESGTGGTKEFTFTIPDSLKGLEKIAIRLQSPVSAYYAYNWFWNNSTSGSSGPAPTPVPGSGLPAGVIPTISISAVVKDSTVTFVTKNFPANDSFEITMNYYGTLGVGGVKVGTLDTGSGGALTFTADIPNAMKGQQKIAIRLYSSKTGYYAYNWFWNNTYP